MIRHIINIAVLVILSVHSIPAHSKECIAAYDFGLGGTFSIRANPDEDSTGASKLVQEKPFRDQIAAWEPTYLSTTGTPQDSNSANYYQSKMKIYIDGAWGPWGGDPETIKDSCPIRACSPSNPKDAVCMKGGAVVGMPSTSNTCKLEDGVGLYGLIALEADNGQRMDPNDLAYAKSLPTQFFRTFKAWPLKQDKDGKFFELDFTQQCDPSQPECIADKARNGGQQVVAKGGLYFKILDRYYQDNTGGYFVTVVSGVVSEKGLIQTTIEAFTKVMQNITKKMYISLTSDLGFITAVRALLILYVAFTGLMFFMGMINIHQGELITRLVKVGIITALISDTSWDFFNTYLFSFFTDGAANVAVIITKATFTYSSEFGFGKFILPDDASPLSVFDSLLNIIKNPSIHKKIAALLLFEWYFVFIIFIYLCLFILIMAIIRSVVLYITATMLIAILLVTSPLFLTMFLFKITKEMFDNWLKQLLANAMMMVIVAASIALMANLILDQLYQLLYYKSCWDIVWSLKLGKWHLFDIWFWAPAEPEQLRAALTPEHFFSFLLVCVLFNAFMGEIPEMIDALSGAFLQPISGAYHAATSTFERSVFARYPMNVINVIRAPLAATAFGQRTLGAAHQTYGSISDRFTKTLSGGATPSTDAMQSVRDIVAKPAEVIESIVTPTDKKGFFDGQ